jgi:mono/diheme cytochrome c family protein
MKRVGILVVAAAVVCATALLAAPPQAKDSTPALVARGKYLVNQAGQCQDCHTQRNQKGAFIRSKWLQGAPIDFKPVHPVPGWASVSMPIAGLPTMTTDEEAINFLMTGKKADGKTAAPPMPQYRFSKRDATAIVAYLRSLGEEPAQPAERARQ